MHCLPTGAMWADPSSVASASAATSSTASALMIDRSPMATVPSNYQAGPDTTPTISTHYTRDEKLSGKYRQYLRSQRMHPYLSATTTNVAAVAAAANLGQTFPQFAATPTFQHLQQISCYNV
uniref:Centrosomal and chromosomal factor n=1 Tax=Bactrocera dorsalis TaxID=27457 RepID=A0A034V830_BACDO